MTSPSSYLRQAPCAASHACSAAGAEPSALCLARRAMISSVECSCILLYRRQITVNRMNRRRSFSNCCCYAPVRAGADITSGEHSGNVRLEVEWRTLQRPSLRPAVLLRQLAAGEDKTAVIALEHPGERVRVRLDTDEDEHRCS